MSQSERSSRFAGPFRTRRARDTAAEPSHEADEPDESGSAVIAPGEPAGEDQRWVTAIVQEHGKAILSYATRLTGDRYAAEDVVQETLIRAWRNRDHLHEARGSVRGWLLTVTRNIIVDRARARAARPQEVAESPTTPPLVDDHAEQTVTSVALFEALSQLSDEHRAVLIEIYFNDRSVIDAAAILGVPVGTVKSRSYYALRQLRDQVNPADLQ